MSRQLILDMASSQNGVKESPANSNKTIYGQWYGLDGVKWCCIFVSWVYHHAGHSLESIDRPKGYQSCQSGFNFWKRNNCIVKKPQPGDIVLYDWTGNGICDHTGIFVKWMDPEKTVLQAWEGNTAQGNDSDGGQVMLRERKKNLVKAFVTPIALKEELPSFLNDILEKGDIGSDVTVLQKMLYDLDFKITVDGFFGSETENIIKQFQQMHSLSVTGIVTPELLGVIQEEVSSPAIPEKRITSGAFLKKGDSGNVVVSIQHALNSLGINPVLEEDGVFGNDTLAAVKAFQQKKNLKPDGIVGPATFAALGLKEV
ncbi:peptidoglycan-binding protein [Solitalea lacus]|uniref:C40 family peptidase n=1 Tax=Solitalea lacus TaxID=2911172 RepID=UPI001EDC2F05|nr:peptidoglycan-binding protein [Solitalea lacus]UKJ09254.1 peptidoglycan-binding protein [Solitalea lacus]